MAEIECPLPTPDTSDYTAKGPNEREAALDLARHLMRAHCNTEPPFFMGTVQDLQAYAEKLRVSGDLDVDLATDLTDVNAEIRGDIKTGKTPL
jgi:hypothetical protein